MNGIRSCCLDEMTQRRNINEKREEDPGSSPEGPQHLEKSVKETKQEQPVSEEENHQCHVKIFKKKMFSGGGRS